MSDVERALNYDAFGHAEEITGRDYKTDETTGGLGLALFLRANQRKDSLLNETGDSTFRTPFYDFIVMAQEDGFEPVLAEYFDGNHRDEKYVLLWHADGMLLSVESYDTWVNSAELFYVLEPPDHRFRWSLGGGSGPLGGEESTMFYGNKDVREGFRHHLNKIREAEGVEYVKPWPDDANPFYSLLTYEERSRFESMPWRQRDTGADDITEARINRLPEHVRNTINWIRKDRIK